MIVSNIFNLTVSTTRTKILYLSDNNYNKHIDDTVTISNYYNNLFYDDHTFGFDIIENIMNNSFIDRLFYKDYNFFDIISVPYNTDSKKYYEKIILETLALYFGDVKYVYRKQYSFNKNDFMIYYNEYMLLEKIQKLENFENFKKSVLSWYNPKDSWTFSEEELDKMELNYNKTKFCIIELLLDLFGFKGNIISNFNPSSDLNCKYALFDEKLLNSKNVYKNLYSANVTLKSLLDIHTIKGNMWDLFMAYHKMTDYYNNFKNFSKIY